MTEAHDQIDSSAVSGTTLVADFEGRLCTSYDTKQKDVVLIPTRSADPKNPLSRFRCKSLHVFRIFV